MRRAARVDSNHLDICHVLRKCGASVKSTAAIGDGFPDAVIGYHGSNYLVEIKDSSKKWRLTKEQIIFHQEWNGQIIILDSIDDAVSWITNIEVKP